MAGCYKLDSYVALNHICPLSNSLVTDKLTQKWYWNWSFALSIQTAASYITPQDTFLFMQGFSAWLYHMVLLSACLSLKSSNYRSMHKAYHISCLNSGSNSSTVVSEVLFTMIVEFGLHCSQHLKLTILCCFVNYSIIVLMPQFYS